MEEVNNEKTFTSGSEKIHVRMERILQYLCSLIMVQQIISMYSQVKYHHRNVEEALDKVENGFKVAYSHFLSLYDRYCQTTVDNVNGRIAHMLEKIFTFGIGIIFICIQLNLTLMIAIITMIFSLIITGKGALEQASTSATNAQATARKMVSDLSGKVQYVSRVSTEKVEQQANRLLDQANKVAHSALGVALETEDNDKTLWSRFHDLGSRILETSKNRAESDILHRSKCEAYKVMESLCNSLSLTDKVRKNRTWVAGKVGEFRTSLDDLKDLLEKEAKVLKKNPEEILMNYLQRNIWMLPDRLHILAETGSKVLNEQSTNRLRSLISYIEKLNKKLAQVDNVLELKDEVLNEAYDRLTDLLQWFVDHSDCSDYTENLKSFSNDHTD